MYVVTSDQIPSNIKGVFFVVDPPRSLLDLLQSDESLCVGRNVIKVQVCNVKREGVHCRSNWTDAPGVCRQL